MYPYRLDETPQAAQQPHTMPAPTPAPTPTPTPAPTPAPARRGRRAGTAALLALMLAGGVAGGGAAGAYAAVNWLEPRQAAVAQPAATPNQPVSTNQAPASNVAGQVYAKVSEAVVQITVAGQSAGGLTPSGSGSGFVVDASGLILTNYHVVQDARAISVSFNNGEDREAEVLGFDRGNDLALLKVDLPAKTPVAAMGDSDAAQVGETVIAIGSPFGLNQTVTQGIVSAVDRDWAPDNGRVRHGLIQTDAPINPGNSGGPLLNDRGEVIGINTMIESPVRGSVGVGFAIPINTAKQLIPQLETGAELEPVWLGIQGTALDPAIAADQGITVEEGVLVTSVVPDGPADQAGIQGGQGENERIARGGDVITAVDGQAVTEVAQISDKLNGKNPGDQVTLTVLRDGQQQEIQVTLQGWPAQAE